MSKRARAVEERHVSEEYAASLLDEASRLEPGDSIPVGDHIVTNAGDGPVFTMPEEAERDAVADDFGPALTPIGVELSKLSERRTAMRENFRRMASKRVTAILDGLDRLKNLANTNAYDWTDEQELKIANAIGMRFDEVMTAFHEAKKPRERAAKVKETFEL